MPIPETIGDFAVKGLLGKGAMGEVYEGVDTKLGRRVAIKILGRKHRESEEFKQRFLREGRALAAMNHPNVVQIYVIGEFEGRPYMAMEFLDGEDIGIALKKRGPLHPGDAAEAIRQAAIGLIETKRVGVVHRDVKPSNLVVSSTMLKVTDFGLAKALQEDLSITATGVFVGTPDYLAPEQALGKEVDSRADVYALGCSLYHMCSGHPPFRKSGQDDHYTAVVRRHLKAERPELKLEIRNFDEQLSDVCRRMMSRRPDVRPTLDELSVILGEVSGRIGGQIPPRHQPVNLRKDDESLADGEAAPQTQVDDQASGGPRMATIIAVAIGITIGIGIGLVYVLLNG